MPRTSSIDIEAEAESIFATQREVMTPRTQGVGFVMNTRMLMHPSLFMRMYDALNTKPSNIAWNLHHD